MFSAPFNALFVKPWKQFTLPKPLSSWIVDRFERYVFTEEVFNPLTMTAQLTKSQSVASDKGHWERRPRSDSNCWKQLRALCSLFQELEVMEAWMRPLAGPSTSGRRSPPQAEDSSKVYLGAACSREGALPETGDKCLSALELKKYWLTVVIVVLRVCCPGPFPGRLAQAPVRGVARLLEGVDGSAFPVEYRISPTGP
jgi:hypothetical protein